MTSPLFKKKKKIMHGSVMQLTMGGEQLWLPGSREGPIAHSGGSLCCPRVETPQPFPGSSVVQANGNVYEQLIQTSGVSARLAAQTSMAVEAKVRTHFLKVCRVRGKRA